MVLVNMAPRARRACAPRRKGGLKTGRARAKRASRCSARVTTTRHSSRPLEESVMTTPVAHAVVLEAIVALRPLPWCGPAAGRWCAMRAAPRRRPPDCHAIRGRRIVHVVHEGEQRRGASSYLEAKRLPSRMTGRSTLAARVTTDRPRPVRCVRGSNRIDRWSPRRDSSCIPRRSGCGRWARRSSGRQPRSSALRSCRPSG